MMNLREADYEMRSLSKEPISNSSNILFTDRSGPEFHHLACPTSTNITVTAIECNKSSCFQVKRMHMHKENAMQSFILFMQMSISCFCSFDFGVKKHPEDLPFRHSVVA